MRDITRSPWIFESWAMMSSVMPSEKYSLSCSPLMLSNGSTATKRWDSGTLTSGEKRCCGPEVTSELVPSSAAAKSAAVAKRASGSLASAFLIASSIAAGISPRPGRTLGTGSTKCLMMTACALSPV